MLPLTIRPDLASELKPENARVRIVHDGKDPNDNQVHPVENELFVHMLCCKDLAEYLQALDKLVRRRARTINAAWS